LSLQLANANVFADKALKEHTASNAFKPIYEYIERFENENPHLIKDNRVCVKFVIERKLNNKKSDMTIQEGAFVPEKEIDKSKQNVVAVKERLTTEKYPYKPAQVVATVKESYSLFNMHKHTLAWKHYKARPEKAGKKKFQNKYAAYHHLYPQGYLYSEEWITFIVNNYDDILAL